MEHLDGRTGVRRRPAFCLECFRSHESVIQPRFSLLPPPPSSQFHSLGCVSFVPWGGCRSLGVYSSRVPCSARRRQYHIPQPPGQDTFLSCTAEIPKNDSTHSSGESRGRGASQRLGNTDAQVAAAAAIGHAPMGSSEVTSWRKVCVKHLQGLASAAAGCPVALPLVVVQNCRFCRPHCAAPACPCFEGFMNTLRRVGKKPDNSWVGRSPPG